MTLPTEPQNQVAALIDVENVELDSLQWLFDQVSNIGRLTVKRAYGDWSTARAKRDQVLSLGLEPVHQFHSASGKNSADLRLTIDAIDLLYSSPIDTFLIVSADTDFVPLVNRLRAAGKTVIAAGRRSAASETLIRSVDRFYDLDGVGKARVKQKPQDGKGSSDKSIMELVRRAVESAADEQGQVRGAKLHETLQRLDPSFNYQSLGFKTFTNFLESVDGVVVSRVAGGGDSTQVELADELSGSRGSVDGDGEWADNIHAAWSAKAGSAGDSIHGSVAGGIAAKTLNVGLLKNSPHKTLNSLIESSAVLQANWIQQGNRVTRI